MQLQYKDKTKMRATLQNQAHAIDAFQRKWHMAGSEAQVFTQRTRPNLKTLLDVRCPLLIVLGLVCKENMNVVFSNMFILCKTNDEIHVGVE